MSCKFLAALAAAVALFLAGTPAHAQAIAWVSATGSGSACTFAAPCNNFAAAITAAGSFGAVHCLTPGSYATAGLNITSSITIDCTGGVVAGNDGSEETITINSGGGFVNLRGIAVTGDNTASTGINIAAGNVSLDGVTVSGFNQGMAANPASSGAVSVTNSIFENNGTGVVVVAANSNAQAQVSLSHVTIQNNGTGIEISGSGGRDEVNLTDSVVASNSDDGVDVIGTGTQLQFLTVQRSSIVMNGGNGIDAQGAKAFLLIGESTVAWNAKSGIEVQSPALVFSYRNNQVNGNATSSGGDITGTVSTAGLQ